MLLLGASVSVAFLVVHRYNDVASFLADSEELMGIYGLRAPDLSIPPEHDFAR